jgi:hypothetical protein
MSVNPSPELKSLLEAALDEFEKRSGTNLLEHQITDKLVNCQSVDSVIDVLQEEAPAFRNPRGDDGKLMTWLKRTANVLHILSTSSILGEGIGLVRLHRSHKNTLRNPFLSSAFPASKSNFRGNRHTSWGRCPMYLGSLEHTFVTPVAFARRSKTWARVTMPWSIFSNLSNLSSGGSTSIQRSHPRQR